MFHFSSRRWLAMPALLAVALAGLLACSRQQASQAPPELQPLLPQQPLAAPVPTVASAAPGAGASGSMADVLADVRRRSFFLVPAADHCTLLADNYSQRLLARLEPGGYTLSAVPASGRTEPAWRVRWQLRGIGRAGQALLRPAAAPRPEVANEHATYQHPAFAVDFDNTPAGVRQTFRLPRRPAGQGAVEVQLRVQTDLAVRRATATELAFGTDSATVLTYNGLKAWDATGHPLAAHLRLSHGHDLALVVDDAGARYPITIDPLASTPGTTLTGTTAGDAYGTVVAHIGDVSGDGYGDVAIGAPNATGANGASAGKIYVYLGASTGHATTPTYVLDYAAAVNGRFGTSISGAGDVNGDGYGDMLVGEPGYNGNRGRVYLFYGTAGGFSAVYAISNGNTDGQMGTAVAGLGDVNGDGYDDIGFGLPTFSTDVGAFYVSYGRSALGYGTTSGIGGSGSGGALGSAMAGAGDVNGDGYADFLVGAPSSGAGVGTARLYLGGSSLGYITFTRNTNADRFGASVASAGDVDGDGYADFLMGAPGTGSGAGAAYYYRGATTITSSLAPTTLSGAAAGDAFGRSVSGLSDANGDGYADFAVGAPGASSNTGRVYYYAGTATAGTFALPQTFDGTTAGDQFGSSLSGGDGNGDGYGDLLVGAPGVSSSTGRSYTFYGSPGLLSTGAALATRNGESTNDNFGYSVANAGDINADGHADVVVGAYGNTNKGRIYVYYGTGTGLNTAAPDTRSGEAGNNYFGYSVSSAGDVNGDGYADLIVGAYGNSNKGRVYVYYGSSTGLSTNAPDTRSGEANGDDFGLSVAGAGDVNGDGYADVVVGAPSAATSTGRAYVYLGSATGLSAAAPATYAGTAANDNFGYSVASAGDIDGDRYADVLVGAYGTTTNTGRLYVYHGSSTGLGATAATTRSGEGTNNYFGQSVAGAGDVNGDGYADVVVGAPRNTANTGRSYVYYGSATGLSGAAPDIRSGETANSYFGTSVASAGDVNGDGYADVAAGAPGYATNTGRAYVYYGSATGLRAATVSTRTGEAASNFFGQSIASGDVTGDGYADLLVGAYGTTTNTGRLYLYHGNETPGRLVRLRLLNTDLATPLQPAANKSSQQFGIGMRVRATTGRLRARLVWEVVGGNSAFSQASLLPTSTSYSGRGAWTDIPVAATTELTALVTKVGYASRVRARLEYGISPLAATTPGAGTGGAAGRARYGPWQYAGASFVANSNQSTVLPVVLTAFTAQVAGQQAVRLRWSTASELRSAYFALERSLDGQEFAEVGRTAAAGSSTSARSYTFLDARLPGGAPALYYRLRQVDQDGSTTYSPVRRVVLTAPGLALYPNPAQAATTLTGAAPGARVQVLTMQGRCVYTSTASAEGRADLSSLAQLPAGVYLVQSGQQSVRLLVR